VEKFAANCFVISDDAYVSYDDFKIYFNYAFPDINVNEKDFIKKFCDYICFIIKRNVQFVKRDAKLLLPDRFTGIRLKDKKDIPLSPFITLQDI
jgi:hypothetical protein